MQHEITQEYDKDIFIRSSQYSAILDCCVEA